MNPPVVVAPNVEAPPVAPKLNPDVKELAVVAVAGTDATADRGAIDAVGNAGGADVKAVAGAVVVLAAGAPNEKPKPKIDVNPFIEYLIG